MAIQLTANLLETKRPQVLETKPSLSSTQPGHRPIDKLLFQLSSRLKAFTGRLGEVKDWLTSIGNGGCSAAGGGPNMYASSPYSSKSKVSGSSGVCMVGVMMLRSLMIMLVTTVE